MTADVLARVVVPVAVIVVMLAVGLNLRIGSIRENLQHPRNLIVCTLLQIVFLPVAVLALIGALAPPPVFAAAMFAVAISPGGALSNVFTHLLGGNLALSVFMTIATTLLVSVTAPAAAGLVAATGWLTVDGATHLSPVAIAWDLVRVSLLPISLGIMLARFVPGIVTRLRPAMDALCMLSLAAVITCSAIVSWPVARDGALDALGYAAALSLVSLLVGSAVAAALPAADRSACVIEFGVRNLPIALLLVSGAGASAEVVAFLLFYFIANTAILLGLALLLRTQAGRRIARTLATPGASRRDA